MYVHMYDYVPTSYMLFNIKVLFTKSLDVKKFKKYLYVLINTYVMLSFYIRRFFHLKIFYFFFNGTWPSKFFALSSRFIKPVHGPYGTYKAKNKNK